MSLTRGTHYRKSSKLELIVGVEPTTFSLRMRCSAIKLYQQTRLRSRCSAIKRLSKERSRLRSRFPTSRQRRVFHREPYISASRSVNITERRLLFNYFLPISQRLRIPSARSLQAEAQRSGMPLQRPVLSKLRLLCPLLSLRLFS